jgi:copper chaperone CopZ
MKRIFSLLAGWILVLVLFTGCARKSWKETTLFVSGPCESCPTTRVADALKERKGVFAVKVDSTNSAITVTYDAQLTDLNQLVAHLNEYGYGTSDFPTIILTHVSECCVLSEEDRIAANLLGGSTEQVEDDAEELEGALVNQATLVNANGASPLAAKYPLATYQPQLEPSQAVDLLTQPDLDAQLNEFSRQPQAPSNVPVPAALDDEIYRELFDLSRF